MGARKTKYTPEKKCWQDNNTHGSYSSDTRSNGSTGSTLRSRGSDFGVIQRHPLRHKQYKQPFCSGPYGRDYYDLEGNKIDFSRYRPEHFDLPYKHNYIGWSTEDIYARIREVNTQIYTLTEELGLLHSMTPRKETYPNRNVDKKVLKFNHRAYNVRSFLSPSESTSFYARFFCCKKISNCLLKYIIWSKPPLYVYMCVTHCTTQGLFR